jgi:hypothetical protein
MTPDKWEYITALGWPDDELVKMALLRDPTFPPRADLLLHVGLNDFGLRGWELTEPVDMGSGDWGAGFRRERRTGETE